MDIETFERGQLVRLEGRFYNVNTGLTVAPDVVGIEVTTPTEATTAYVYGTDAELKLDDDGSFYLHQSADAVGPWTFRWYSTGNGQAAGRGRFIVEP